MINDIKRQTKPRRKLTAETSPRVQKYLDDINPKKRRAQGPEKLIKVSRFIDSINIPAQVESYQLKKELVLNAPPESSTLYNCVRGYIPGETTDKIFHKVVTCGKENCSTCGADYSVTHNRRINRAYPKILQLSSVGYLVVTVPDFMRNAFLSKRVLMDFRNFIRRKLKRDYKTRGLIRYHWCGDDYTTWKPHLNILMEGKYWPDIRLEGFRNAVALWLTKYFNLSTPVAGNIHYAYVNPSTFKDWTNRETGETIPGPVAAKMKIKHWVKYVLRATAKKVTDYKILDTIKGYQNTGYFGKFEKVEMERDAATAILAGCDKETGELIHWGEMIKPSVFNTEFKRYAQEVIYIPDEKKPDKKIHLGIYVTEKIDLIPAGVQIGFNDLNTIFANEKAPPI
jgi:hypothetical protein